MWRAICGMSDSVFSRFFKKNTGHGFVRYVNRMRINRACILLTQNETPVTEICFATGLQQSLELQSPVPANYCGLTPSEYRRQAKRNMRGSTELIQIGGAGLPGGDEGVANGIPA